MQNISNSNFLSVWIKLFRDLIGVWIILWDGRYLFYVVQSDKDQSVVPLSSNVTQAGSIYSWFRHTLCLWRILLSRLYLSGVLFGIICRSIVALLTQLLNWRIDLHLCDNATKLVIVLFTRLVSMNVFSVDKALVLKYAKRLSLFTRRDFNKMDDILETTF